MKMQFGINISLVFFRKIAIASAREFIPDPGEFIPDPGEFIPDPRRSDRESTFVQDKFCFRHNKLL